MDSNICYARRCNHGSEEGEKSIMIILESRPIEFDLNTYGGFSLRFEKFRISNTIGGQFSVLFNGEGVARTKGFDSILEAYGWALAQADNVPDNWHWHRDAPDGRTVQCTCDVQKLSP